jgi:uncharacterized protein YqeY
MALPDRVAADLTAAMKNKDQARLAVLRMAKAALMNREIEKKAPLDDSDAAKVLQALVRQREDSVVQFRGAGREELAVKEEAEIAVLRLYLPEEATPAEIEAAVANAVAQTGAAGARDIGKVMKAALAALQEAGKPVDGKKVNDAVRRRLSG